MRLKDRVAFVSGMAMGIGEAIAELFAHEGAAIIGADINVQHGNVTAERIRARGGRCLFQRTDVSVEGDFRALVEAGKIDVAVQLSVRNRKDAERDLTMLLTRVGGTKFGGGQTSTLMASVPRSSSRSTASCDRKLTPNPASTAALADSCKPSSMATFRSRGRTPARRSSSSITVRTPAPACIRISGSLRRSSSATCLPANG